MNNYNNYYSSEVLNGVTFHLNFIIVWQLTSSQVNSYTTHSRPEKVGKIWNFICSMVCLAHTWCKMGVALVQ